MKEFYQFRGICDVEYMLSGLVGAMMPKARGLAQRGVPPGWLEESDPASVTLYVMDGLYRLPFSVLYRLP
jgi:hypothetical protein